ncbi:glycosyltransferase family 2 protein [Oxalobacteraceae bacterium CAVE-383]|nr:glycosyltransferase family 2 protein [Oxalobacteraceae bacterium CAVE-383]
MKLSVILITKNEAFHLQACLESVAFADQLVVVDSGSTDNTVEIARGAGAQVIQTADWPGFGPQKNRALAAAEGDWILSLDADERVTPELAAEIQAILALPQPAEAYEIPRKSWYCGRFIRHAGWTPDYVTRLIRRGSAQFSDDLVHERIIVNGATGRLKMPLLHYSFRNFSQVLNKVDLYSTLSARQRYDRGQRSSVGKAVLHGLATFIRTYIFKRGFLDGWHGLALAISNAEGSYYRYMKLWLLEQDAIRDNETRKS